MTFVADADKLVVGRRTDPGPQRFDERVFRCRLNQRPSRVLRYCGWSYGLPSHLKAKILCLSRVKGLIADPGLADHHHDGDANRCLLQRPHGLPHNESLLLRQQNPPRLLAKVSPTTKS